MTHVCVRLANQGEAAQQQERPKIRPSSPKWVLSGVRGALRGPLALVSWTQLVGHDCGMPKKSGLRVNFSTFSFCGLDPLDFLVYLCSHKKKKEYLVVPE